MLVVAALVSGLLASSLATARPDNHEHSGHAAQHNEVDTDSGVSGEGEYYNYNNYYQDPAYQQYYYGQDQGYGQYSAQSGSGGGELVAKQEDGGLIDRLFFSSRIPLPIAITLFVVDLVISAGFLLFPVTYQVEAESRKRRAAPEAGPGSEAGLGLALRSIQGLVARLDCVEVARCEVAQLAQSPAFPTMAAMIRPFVPAPVITRFHGVQCSSVTCAEENSEALDQNGL